MPNYRGTWNAATNTPTLVAAAGNEGDYFVVDTDGATSLDGVSSWKAKDWILFTGGAWTRVITGPLVVVENDRILVQPGGSIQTRSGVGEKNGTGVTVVERGDGSIHQSVFTFAAVAIALTDATTAGNQGSLKFYDFPAGQIEILGATCDLTTLAGAGGIVDGAALVGSLGTAAAGVDNATLTTTEANIIPSITGTLTAGAGTLKGKSMPTLGTLGSITALTDSTAGVAGNTLAALPALTDSPASQDALRDDLDTNVWPVLKAWAASLAAKVNAILALALNARRVFDGTATAVDAYLNLAVPDADSSANDTVTVSGTITLTWINHGDV